MPDPPFRLFEGLVPRLGKREDRGWEGGKDEDRLLPIIRFIAKLMDRIVSLTSGLLTPTPAIVKLILDH